MKRKEIKWRREGRGTMAGRQDGIILMKYTDLLELEVMRHALGEMGHQILMGHQRGEGWPDGT